MELEKKIQEDIKSAMKEKNNVKLNAVRSIKSAILLAKTAEGGPKELEDSDIIKLIEKLSKQRKEAAEQYIAAGRKELADNELAEAVILDAYLPKKLDEAEVEERLKAIIAQLGASGPQDMGKVMGTATKALAGLSDGKTISSIVRRLLS
ncbi:MAG: GatB/YqeY domain-containing protein [Bacteroidales bacterium]|nr:GatB/YqeY domain-containing protein [Bacteroidales bacterium]MCI5619859.1 GatB/YqeY domain-containing protein [Rikenellaceae bacterium]